MSNNNYRQQYEKKLGVELVTGASIHHEDWKHENNKIKNLVALPQSLHDQINLASTRLPKLCSLLSRENVVKFIKNKNVKLFKEYISAYDELLFWIEIKNCILQFGYDYLLIQYNEYVDKIKEVYKLN